jgi:hypothetical protein
MDNEESYFHLSVKELPNLTKREYFAAMAMQGLLSGWSTDRINADTFSRNAVSVADALIRELDK